VVHAHVSIVSPAALGGARAARRQGLPLVVTFHSVVPQMQLLARVAGDALGSARWQACFSAVSERVARDVQPFAPGQSIQTLPNGVDVAFWRGVPPRERHDGITRLVSVMRLNPKKRPLALVEMMWRLRADPRVELRIAGDGPWRKRLVRAIARAGLSKRVILLGRLSREEIRALFAASDIFVLPTIRESFGLAALEARCAGLPVIAMRASGVSEIVEHDVNGLLAESDAEMAGHVERLIRDDPKRAAIAAENRRSTPRYAWPNVLDAHLALYREAISLVDVAHADEARAALGA
ncbi:MAG: glycosyltransferase family 4 protein, partial [Gemmatimonadaceae bacterium]